MKSVRTHILSATVLSAVLLGATAMAVTLPFSQAAYADSGNGGGNGGGNAGGNGGGKGNGGDKAGERGNSGQGADASSKGKSMGAAKADARTDKSSNGIVAAQKPVTKPGKGHGLGDVLGAHPSELGALNAAKASDKAFKNASPNSRIGRIAAYRDAVLGREDLLADYATVRTELDAATPPSRPADAIAQDIADLDTEIGTSGQTLAELQAELAAAPDDADTSDLQAEIEALTGSIETLSAERAAAAAELEQAAAYAELAAREAALREAIVTQPETEMDLLQAAANKPVTDGVVVSVNDLLGLEPVDLTLPDAPEVVVIEEPVSE